ncbi:methyltransferase domain-containing protein [Scytonema sp. UIC 10036]|uniref:class I SAM-dependent methyltransferase n=1 Tax=Scytonema sp. UIC 10036 TaxID=2304196 RepID=UPI0012DA815B|nr:methyltransferase domain-containing protein [Scytonema sp. UIC 10036]MUG93359.1 methyltransferase domain-containing protein [Scytonema sp. UIC 10036]
MIRVLQNRPEIDVATHKIQKKGLPQHFDIYKNWDHLLISELIVNKDRHSFIIDLGCGECCTLNFLSALGFQNLHGIDLKILPNRMSTAYALYEGDIIKTLFDSDSCDVAITVSTIEHGVDLPAFFAEVSRLLKVGGLLFITSDYWEEHIEIDNSIKPFALDWKIFSQREIEELIVLAKTHNLVLEGDENIPSCLDKPIHWYYDYTFIALVFKKVPATQQA